MCGRVVQARPLEELAELYGAPVDEVARAALRPKFNVAPTDPIAVVLVEDGMRRLTAQRWGLLPGSRPADPRRGPLINVRAETIAASPLFRRLLDHRRCLVPVNGFYEWQKIADRRQPYFIHRPDDRPLTLAGLWSPWRVEPLGGIVGTCAIVTTAPDQVVGQLHDRMPAILEPTAAERWLDPAASPSDLLAEVRMGRDAGLEAYPVAPWVNSVRNDGPRLLERAAIQEPLFAS